MKQINTRFSPTPNSDLHLGHLLTALVNEHEAHKTGGKFYLFFDDNQEIWNLRQPRDYIEDVEHNTVEIFEKLGVQIDQVVSSRAIESKIHYYMNELDAYIWLPMRNRVMAERVADWANHNAVMYPYVPYLTMEKVILDFLHCINLVIRGEDLMTEFCLYDYFCDVLRLPTPEHVYISRLKLYDGEEISKTNGFPSIKKLFEMGLGEKDIIDVLRESALINPQGNFVVRNIKPDPRLPEGIFD